MTAATGREGDLQGSSLHRLAARHCVEGSYVDSLGLPHTASDTTLVRILRALGEPINSPSDASGILDGEVGQTVAGQQTLPAVVVAWDGLLPPVVVGRDDAHRAVTVELALEDGADPDGLIEVETREGSTVVVAKGPLPFGIHDLAVSVPSGARTTGSRPGARDHGEPDEITVISAPATARPVGPRAWALFAPTYGLSDDRPTGRGDLTCLEALGRWAGSSGASYLATLPILADFSRHDDPDGRTNPYAPLSRMWWNEGYLDASRVPELADLGAPERVDRSDGTADPGIRAAGLRQVLVDGVRRLHEAGGERLHAYEAFVADRPGVVAYARFRAAREHAGKPWQSWPGSWRHGLIDDTVLDPEALRAHIYAQFVTDEQVKATSVSMQAAGCGLMLDLPVGCRVDGFDPWAYPESFADGVTVGAPPDRFVAAGQDWGFRPLHPEGERRSGYAVTGGALRHLLRHAAALRLDHAMGLARLWWIPEGMSAAEGAYVRYRSEELIALCCLEAWRNDAALVGEDLGTVESSFTDSLAVHSIAGMHVALFDLESEDASPMEPLSPRRGSVALVDTHDTATFAGWFTGYDLDERVTLGLLDDAQALTDTARRDRARRTLVDRLVASDLLEPDCVADPVAVHEGLVLELAESEAGVVILSLEDCLGELEPQNIPGTTIEHANFCGTLARSLPEIATDARVIRTLSKMSSARPRAVSPEIVVERAEH
jgi:4-alpha-glucanotransferase